jgi:TP901-1 family phage major tail protein
MSADNACNFQIVVPDFGTYAGSFRIASVEFGGETEGGVTYSISLESTGAVTFTAA